MAGAELARKLLRRRMREGAGDGAWMDPGPEPAARGTRAPDAPVMGTPAPEPQTRGPAPEPPARGAPISGPPPRGAPVPETPVRGAPAPEPPARGAPVSGPPARGAPAPEPPARGAPISGPPARGAPTPEPPARGTPISGPPARGAPAPEPPVRGAPVPGPPAKGTPAPEPPAPAASADPELSALLSRRRDLQAGRARPRRPRVFNPYTEFPEFSRRLIRDLETKFKLYDAGRDGFIDLMELKLMMEKLGAPQTHLGLKSMIREVDEDFDGKLSFREFLLIFHKAAAGELQEDSGLMALAKLSEIDVALEGVKGAKDFFEAKVQALACASKFEAELRAEQEERKLEEENRRLRQAAFRELKATFSAQAP